MNSAVMEYVNTGAMYLGYATGSAVILILLIIFGVWLENWVKLVKGHKEKSVLEELIREQEVTNAQQLKRIAALQTEVSVLKSGQPYR